MKYIYETLCGHIAVEVDEKWHKWLTEADKHERNEERRHTRSDHKYACGTPLSLDNTSRDDWLIFSATDTFRAVELKVDLEMALGELTDFQRRYFVMNRIHGYSLSEIARADGKQVSTVMRIVDAAAKRIKTFLR